VPTIGGLLLLGKDRFARFPDAWIRRVDLPEQIEHVWWIPQIFAHSCLRAWKRRIAFVQKYLTRESIIEGIRKEDRWSVPLVAIREALMNAIVHADYAHRRSISPRPVQKPLQL
jgi:predicted HTH transcriptional regulator